eukprot:scaffold22004_cov62-Phaeocystis_antarctica.AAC.2
MAHCSSMSEAPHTKPPVRNRITQLCSNGVTGAPAEQWGRVSVLRAALEWAGHRGGDTDPAPSPHTHAHTHDHGGAPPTMRAVGLLSAGGLPTYLGIANLRRPSLTRRRESARCACERARPHRGLSDPANERAPSQGAVLAKAPSSAFQKLAEK